MWGWRQIPEHELDNKGSCKVTAVNNNGTLSHKKGVEIGSANVRRCVPHCKKEASTAEEHAVTQIRKLTLE